MPRLQPVVRPTGLAVLLIVAGTIGLAAAGTLTLDKLHLLADPNAQLSCSFSVLIGCATNLSSAQGNIFGFPNSLLGVVGWTVVIAIGVAILAGARFARWYWIGLNVGVTGAIALVLWLIQQSIFVLDILCPWCMVTWSVTFPTFLAVTFYNVKTGNIPAPESVRRVASVAFGWLPVITLGCLIAVAVVAQVEMDFLHRL